MIIGNIITSAESVGINARVFNSSEKLETQLTRLTREEQLPILLVAWDIEAKLDFDVNGFIKNPDASISCILLTKPDVLDKDTMQDMSEEMAALYVAFIQDLSDRQRQIMKTNELPITNATYKLVPSYGMSKHSGVIGKFNVKQEIITPC